MRSFVIGAVPLVAAAIGITIIARQAESPESRPSAVDHKVTDGGLRLSALAPQWKYLETAMSVRSAPLSPLPAPARVMVAESRAAPVFATLPGRVEKVTVQLGQEVKVGDRLLAIRSSLLPDLRHAEESAGATLAVKSAIVERVRDLVKLRAVAEKDLILAEQERREAELALTAAEGKRRSLRLEHLDDSSLYWVKATRRGTVVERRVLVGMEVGPDRIDPLLSIADLSEVVVIADVLDTETTGIAIGQAAWISGAALTGRTIEGKIEHVAAVVDPMRRTVAVRIRVPNPDRILRPNAFARVTFSAGGEPRVVVPAAAIVTADQSSVMFVKRDLHDGIAALERREVRVGRIRDGRAEILSGLEEGEAYVAQGALLVLNALDLER